MVLTLVKKKDNKCILYPKYLSVCEHGCTFAPEKITGLTILKGISTMIILNFVAVKLASVVKAKAVALMNK